MSYPTSAVQPRILFQMSGSIAAYKACEVISSLVKAGCEVKVAASKSLYHFIGRSTLEGLTGNKVFDDVFSSGDAMEHINLERWADLILLCPATGNQITALANGTASDAIGTLFLAHHFEKPYLIVPAMNHTMWAHPAVEQAVKRLKDWGILFQDPESGTLACGEEGAGRLAEPDQILATIDRLLGNRVNGTADPSHKKKKILVVYGGTEEQIDAVRTISNFSTGRTGAHLVDWFRQQGHEVVALGSHRAERPSDTGGLREFKSFQDLENQLRVLLAESNFDAVVQLAAVSDFSVSGIEIDGEITPPKHQAKMSSQSEFKIVLSKNHKIIDLIKSFSVNKAVKVIAFKLTHTNDQQARDEAVAKLTNSTGIDFVVHNDLQEIAAGDNAHLFEVYKGADIVCSGKTKTDMAIALDKIVSE
ncbi:bifunctional phosphopantothenoylcysteine decarboxylase/phosphopantothenate--cysteine ligase CoaBC [Pseudomonadales bacterium]|nr:bifunctional phosphopantothenoylcysteine decarboxylase/phosphopantothenate--cysteine ligase CoaBC [Pseudomonadales bacterium]MDC1019125.1 bifunctional phosphopantothenoylcysteine decarboxylase/phosphopantothenate--cysteine ligase CoaBC [Pseudomonadales bacterium]